MSITAIIPTYRNPEYLDLCLKSATKGRVMDDTDIMVVIDGYVEESQHIVDKYENVKVLPLPENKGMQYALNIGVMNAETERVFILNDDNVFGPDWDEILRNAVDGLFYEDKMHSTEDWVITVNQVEPRPSIFDFVVKNFGPTAESFQFDEWWEYEPTIGEFLLKPNGRIFPFMISKKWYQAVGGFDTWYDSPFWCDVDFFTKLELIPQIQFHRIHTTHLYHFGSMATKNRADSDAITFKSSEHPAAQYYHYKWGFLPDLVRNAIEFNNRKTPVEGPTIKGIEFR